MKASLRVSLLGLRVQRLGQWQVALQVFAAEQQSPLLFQTGKHHASHRERSLPSKGLHSLSLTCQLFSVSSQGPQHAQQLMREDEVWDTQLAAQATVQLSGHSLNAAGALWDRLNKGEHVPMALQLQPLIDDIGSSASRDLPALDGKQELTVELMLIGNADIARSSLQHSLSSRNSRAAAATRTEEPGDLEDCQLLCYIAMATGLPLTIRTSKQLEASSFRVTASIVAALQAPTGQALSASAPGNSVASESLSSAATAAVKSSATGPVWNQWLCCDFTEQQRSSALLQLTLESEAGNVPIARCHIQLATLQLHVHYNLQLTLPIDSPQDDHVSLFTTLCLAKCPALAATALAQASQQQLAMLQARLLTMPTFRDVTSLVTLWRVQAGPKAVSGPPPTFTSVDASDQTQIQRVLQQLNEAAMLDQDGIAGQDVVPVSLNRSAGTLQHNQACLWLPDKAFSSATAALVLDVYDCKVAPDTLSDTALAKADLRTSAVAKLERLRSRGSVEGTPPINPSSPATAQAARAGKGTRPTSSSSDQNSPSGDTSAPVKPSRPEGAKTGKGTRPSSSSTSQNSPSGGSPVSSSNNSGASSRASSRGSQREAAIPETSSATKAASAETPKATASQADDLSSTVTAAAAAAMTPLGTVVFPLRQLSNDRSGKLTELEGQLVLASGAELDSAAEQDLLVSIELQIWSAEAFAADQSCRQDVSASEGDAEDLSVPTPPSQVSYLVSVLTEDLIAKQQALEQLQRAVLKAEGSSQIRQWQVEDMEKSNHALAADLFQLRKLLHEEKSSSKAALSVKGWDRLPREELVLRACQAVAAVAREKSRCAELVYRLQQTHEDAIEAKQLQARFAELQEAHVIQARFVRKLEHDKTQSKQTLDTVKTQEGVISKLQGLLQQAMAERRVAVTAAEKLQQQLANLESTLDSKRAQMDLMQEELGRLRAFNKYEEIERVQRMATDETEKVRQQLTAEAEAARSQAAADVEAARQATKLDAEAVREAAKADIEAAREAGKSDVEAVRQRSVADVDALRAQYAESTEQLRAQLSAEAESARTARFEEVERVRSEKNAEIAVLRERQVSDAELARTQRLSEAETAAASVRQVQEEAGKQVELLTAECEALRSQMHDTRLRESNAKLNAEEFESERLAASMRADKAETSAIAAQHELIDVTKRYAREIAMLKTRLAEKDAQLMGGFGALSSLQFGACGGGLPDPEVIAATLPEQSPPYIRSSWIEARHWGKPSLNPLGSPALPALHFQTPQHAQHEFSSQSSSPVKSRHTMIGHQQQHVPAAGSVRDTGDFSPMQKAAWPVQSSSPDVSAEAQLRLPSRPEPADADHKLQQAAQQQQVISASETAGQLVGLSLRSSADAVDPSLDQLSSTRPELQPYLPTERRSDGASSVQSSTTSSSRQANVDSKAGDKRLQVQQLPIKQQKTVQPTDSVSASGSELESDSETASSASEPELQPVQQTAQPQKLIPILSRSAISKQSSSRRSSSVRSTRSSGSEGGQPAVLQQKAKQQLSPSTASGSGSKALQGSVQLPATDKQPATKTRWNVFAKPAK